jgi:hypothetical protein
MRIVRLSMVFFSSGGPLAGERIAERYSGVANTPAPDDLILSP